MLKPVTDALRRTRLADMGAIRVQGADAIKFLQGQVSNDVARLSAQVSVLAGLHNAQGRAIAVIRFVLAGEDEVIGILPRELAGPVATRLAKFVLRAKAKVSDVSAEWDIAGVEGSGVAGELAGAPLGTARRDEDGRLWVRVGLVPGRWLVASRVTPPGIAADVVDAQALTLLPLPDASAMSRDEWRALDIADGIPQVHAATSEAFVAQMLNLDVVGGIAFDKGCYTGQEVIARAHYRGKVKRRMQRFVTAANGNLKPGDAGTLEDGRTYKVVDAVQRADGRCEFLAVTAFGANDGDSTADAAAIVSGGETLSAEQLPLPYSLPS